LSDGLQEDASPNRPRVRDTLEDLHVVAVAGKEERCCRSCRPATHDRNPHRPDGVGCTVKKVLHIGNKITPAAKRIFALQPRPAVRPVECLQGTAADRAASLPMACGFPPDGPLTARVPWRGIAIGMSECEQPNTDERPPPAPEASGDDEQPVSGNDERPPKLRPHFAMPSIEWAGVAHAVRTGLRAGALVVVVSIALGTAAFGAVSFYGQYGAVRNAPNTRAWAGLTAHFAGQAICTSCHALEAGAQDASIHINVSCEGCHGPAAAHASSATAARATVLTEPTSEICVTCHAATAGRPMTFPQIDPTGHFSGGECLRCHDPHSVVAVRPPTVSHPLANLPQCTTCHSPDGLKKIPTGHEIVGDSICLSCHGPAADRKP
jgi:hypothetical protein